MILYKDCIQRGCLLLHLQVLVPRDTNITLDLPNGDKEQLIMQSTDTVAHLRQVVHDKYGIEKSQQILKVILP